jgi:homospermidine synthase
MIKNIEDKNIIFFGCGGVQKCIFHYLDKYFKVDPNKMLIIDLIDYRQHPDVKKWLNQGSKYLQVDINKEYKKIISNLNKNDIIIDLSNRTDSLKFCEECLIHNIHYINTSLEDTQSPNDLKRTEEDLKQTYQYSHNIINTLKNKYKEHATNLLCCGMNPGCITICTKLAILELAKSKPKNQELQLYINERDYARLCQYLEIEIIHCSEYDNADVKNDKINNTWCVNAMNDEYADDCQMTYGTNQKQLPTNNSEMLSEYVVNLNEPSKDIYCESYVPIKNKIIGVVISHSESISGADYYSTPSHSPTIHYVYRYCDAMHRALNEKKNQKYIGNTIPANETHIINNLDDKFDAVDIVGALIITKKKECVWVGSILSNKESHIVGLHSATTSQVAVSVLSFLQWLLDNPKKGACFPEVVNEDYILQRIKPYFNLHIEFPKYKPKSLQFKDMQRTKEEFDKQYF